MGVSFNWSFVRLVNCKDHLLGASMSWTQHCAACSEELEKGNVISLFSGSVLVLSALLELTHLNSLKPSEVDIVIPNF